MPDKIEMDLEALRKELDLYDNPGTEKQRKILEAAEALFGDRGYDAAPTAEIARRAGVTERTLFKHFRTKADLLRRVVFALALKTLLPYQIKQVKAIAQADYPSLAEFLLTIAKDRLSTIQQHGSKLKVVVMELLRNEQFLEQLVPIWRDNVWEEFLKTIRRFQKEGKVRKDLRPEVVARAAILVVMGYIFSRRFLTPKQKFDDHQELTDLVKILVEGVVPR